MPVLCLSLMLVQGVVPSAVPFHADVNTLWALTSIFDISVATAMGKVVVPANALAFSGHMPFASQGLRHVFGLLVLPFGFALSLDHPA